MAERGEPELIRDMVEAINRIERYTAGLAYAAFLQDTRTQDAVVRNLEVLGEAAKGLSADFRGSRKEISWNEVARMRDSGEPSRIQLRTLKL